MLVGLFDWHVADAGNGGRCSSPRPRNMLHLGPGWTPTNFVPTFFHDEPDPNQKDKPRLDIVVSFDNGVSARYHPSAVPIWLTETQPTGAMQTRYIRAKHLRR